MLKFAASHFSHNGCCCCVTCNKCQNVFLIFNVQRVCVSLHSLALGCARASILLYTSLCWHYIFIWSNSITELSFSLFHHFFDLPRSQVEHFGILFAPSFTRSFASDLCLSLSMAFCVWVCIVRHQKTKWQIKATAMLKQHYSINMNNSMIRTALQLNKKTTCKNKQQKFFLSNRAFFNLQRDEVQRNQLTVQLGSA